MPTLTPEIAQQLMYQSMTTGAPTATFNSYGGYDTVKNLAYSSGADATPEWIASYEQRQGLPASEYTQRNASTSSSTSSSSGGGGGGSSTSVAGYSGESGANRGENTPTERLGYGGYSSVNTRALVENTLGRIIDNEFYNENNPQYAENMATLKRANDVMYGNIGANNDWRDWNAIMASSNPIEAAERALVSMYNDPRYLQANAEQLLQRGYLPEQADYTYQQMAERVGSTYSPNWARGTRFEGAYNTQAYLDAVRRGGSDDSFWARWGGNPRTSQSTVGTSGNVGSGGQGLISGAMDSSSAANSNTTIQTNGSGAAGTPGGSSGGMDTTLGAVYGPDGTMYSSAAAARAAGVYNYTRVRPVMTTNASTTATPNPTVNASPIGFGGGLINNVTQGNAMTYFTDNAQVGLPAGVRPAF